MLRSALSRTAVALQGVRQYAQEAAKGAASQAESIEKFVEEFRKHAPSYLDAPAFASSHITPPAAEEAEGTPEELTLTFALPDRTAFKGKAKSVSIPAQNGDFTACPGHVPVIAQMRPGVVKVADGPSYFVAGGYAFVHPDSTADVCAVEAVSLDDLDPEAVNAGLAEAQAQLSAAAGKSALEECMARIKLDAFSAMQSALQAK
ncbi:unnamed protein product [Pedinophyceae sp. YPF-701]|nr:unnamed protein product [Pedinophyceae sp. YPF-701]